MVEEQISYKILRKIQQSEKASPVLSNIKAGFYDSLLDYFRELEERLVNESSEQKKNLLKEELSNMKKIALSIYEFREKKVLLAAISRVRGGNPNVENMIEVEKELFNQVLNAMKSSRDRVLKDDTETKAQKKVEADKLEEEDKKKEKNNSNPVVRIKKDIPDFLGTNENKYCLRKNDIISIPEDMSKTLINRDAAELIDYLA